MLNTDSAQQVLSSKACPSDIANKETLQQETEELKCRDLALDQEIEQLLAEYVFIHFWWAAWDIGKPAPITGEVQPASVGGCCI